MSFRQHTFGILRPCILWRRKIGKLDSPFRILCKFSMLDLETAMEMEMELVLVVELEVVYRASK